MTSRRTRSSRLPGGKRSSCRPCTCSVRGGQMLVAVLALGAFPGPGTGRAVSQTTQPTTQGAPTITYTEPAIGFELELPAGWEYDRTRFQDFKDSLGLLRGREPGGRRALQVLVFRSFPMKPFEDWIVDFGKALAELANAPRVDWQTWSLPPRAGVVLTLTSRLAAVTTRSHYLCVPFDPNTVWVLVYSGSVARPEEEAAIRQDFDRLAASLRIYYDAQEAERLVPAFERGRVLLERLRQQAARVQPDDTERVYEILLRGKPIGYLTRRISREEYVFSTPRAKRRYAKEGLRVRERSWRFADDGTVRHTRLDLFSSFDMQDELMENRQTQIPPPGDLPELLIRTDQVVREGEVLFSSFTTSRDVGLPEPSKPIEVGPVYLDQAWLRLLPWLLRDATHEAYAVACYDFETRALLSHVITPLGEQKLPDFRGSVRVFEFRDGFINRPGRLYSDEHGNLVRLETGELVLRLASRAEIEQRYGQRRDEARSRFRLSDE